MAEITTVETCLRYGTSWHIWHTTRYGISWHLCYPTRQGISWHMCHPTRHGISWHMWHSKRHGISWRKCHPLRHGISWHMRHPTPDTRGYFNIVKMISCQMWALHQKPEVYHISNGSLNLIWFILAHVLLYFCNSCDGLYALVGVIKFIYLFIYI